MKKNSHEAVRTGEAISLAVGSIAVFAMTTVAAGGIPYFETREVDIEQLPE